jgi:hypothetical protein
MKDKLILIGDILLVVVLFNAIKTGSFSIIAGVLCVLAIDVKRRFYPSSKYLYWIVGMFLLVIAGSLIDVGFSRPVTNTDQKYSQIQNLTYQNTAYNFSVTFSEGWKISPRESSDSKAVVQKATKGSATISLAIRDVPLVVEALSSEDKTIKDLMDFEEFKETKNDMEKALPGVRNFEFKQTLVDQIPAYWIKFTGPSTTGDTASEDTVEQYQFFYKNVLYMISTTANSNDFSSMKKEFDEIINNFKITR